MCGISGIILEKKKIISLKKNIKNMVYALIHRGPDKQKYWIDYKNNIALGHTRLSIQDLSIKGSQPMESSNKRYVIVFNGEIYNHFELRKSRFFYNKKWKSTSDTETLIELIQKIGINKTLQQVSGMFAFGLFDKRKKKLYLARDLYGEKPLYFGWDEERFFFSSELSAITSTIEKQTKNFTKSIASLNPLKADYYKENIKSKSKLLLNKIKRLKLYGKKNTP